MMNIFAAAPADPAQPTPIVELPPAILPPTATESELAKHRKLYLDQAIDGSAMEIHRMILSWNMEDKGKPLEEREPIWLYIHSPGGEVSMMWSLVDAIESSDTPVYTVNIGCAASAASLIFLAGAKRFMTKRATVLIHEGSCMMSGDAVKVLDASDGYRKVLKKMHDHILERTRIPASTLSRQKNHDWELDADYCLKNGVCDAIVTRMSEIA